MHEFSLFYEIALVLLVAGVIAMITSLLKQPSVIAYILTGLIVGPLGYVRLHESDVLTTLGTIGITLLLFMVGLELDFQKMKKMGKVAVFTGLGQIVFTVIVGYAIIRLLGFGTVESLFIATALTFSSTIIVVKLLAEKRDLQSLYARIVVGCLIIQDFVALGILLFMGGGRTPGLLGGMPSWQIFIFTLTKALLLGFLLVWLGKRIFPWLLKRFGKADELLLVFSIAWALGLAAFMSLPWVGFSLEIGGFLAGLTLANSQVHFEISAKIKSIRDFFIVMFFIVFGSNLVFSTGSSALLPAIILSLFVLIGNPLILILILGALGYKPRTSFFASVTVAQVSEFSFILMALGYKLGIVGQSAVAVVTLVGLMTIALSSYMILYTNKLYEWFEPMLKLFDFKKNSVEKDFGDVVFKNHVILVGANRLGSHLLESLDKTHHTLVVVDFDPEVAERLEKAGLNAICGDITDTYIQDQVNLEGAKLIISTVPDIHDNIALIDAVNLRTSGSRKKPKLILLAQDEAEAKRLYEKEIDYAIQPHFIGGVHLSKILEEDTNLKSLKKLRAHHLKVMNG